MGVTHHLSAPIPLQLPELGPDTYFTQTQWKTLFALIDAVIPSIVAESAVTDRKAQLKIPESQYAETYEQFKKSMISPPSYDQFQEYLKASPLDNPRFIEQLKRTFQGIPAGSQKQLAGMLDLLETRIGALVATGYCTPIHEQPVHVREGIIKSWNASWVTLWPTVAKSIMKMTKLLFAQTSPLLLELNGYSGITEDYRPSEAFDFNFMQFEAGSEVETIDTDVVIVGSGCGGAVCAKVLSEAGHKVIVVDKGYYFPPSQLPMTFEAAGEYLYEAKGALQNASGTMPILAGSCWGGGGTVNWSASLQPQGFVRQEWAEEGLGFFLTQEFQHCLDRVSDFMGVSDAHIRHNHRANVLLNGAKKLGWTAKPAPQNTGGTEHHCGSCGSGCSSSGKKGPNVTWLPAASEAGAKFIEGFYASEILFDDTQKRTKRAVGILGTWTARDKDGNLHTPESERTKRQVRIRAKKVIVACGTLHSPLLLMRSGLKNRHIGKNLHLHPVAHVNATFDQETKGWEGAILTSVCTSFENLDGKGHGVKVEPGGMTPYLLLYDHPWRNALQWKLDALKCRQMGTWISLARDRDTGRVYAGPDGRPVIDYTPSAFDRKHILAGIVATAKLCYIEGATEIWPLIQNVPSFVRPAKPEPSTPETEVEGHDFDQGINDPAFAAWIRTLENTNFDSPNVGFSSAHQMGTCKMGASPDKGVVDPNGRAWEAQNLYVADASVFPSASGVNPMITNMGIADWIARGISRDLKKEDSAVLKNVLYEE